MPQITEMFCFAVTDTTPEDEGVVAVHTHRGAMPLVGADLTCIESLMPYAQKAADELGKPLRIYQFSHRELIGEVMPHKPGGPS